MMDQETKGEALTPAQAEAVREIVRGMLAEAEPMIVRQAVAKTIDAERRSGGTLFGGVEVRQRFDLS